MKIVYKRRSVRNWVVEVWDNPIKKLSGISDQIPLEEDQYVEINDWCKNTFGYHARTAYHIFELRKESDLNWFLLRWQ